MTDWESASPKADKMLMPDGSVRTMSGDTVLPPSEEGRAEYERRLPIACKYLHEDGSIDDDSGISTGIGDVVMNGSSVVEDGIASFSALVGAGEGLSENDGVVSHPEKTKVSTSGVYEITTDKHGHIVSATRKRLYQHQVKLSLYYSGNWMFEGIIFAFVSEDATAYTIESLVSFIRAKNARFPANGYPGFSSKYYPEAVYNSGSTDYIYVYVTGSGLPIYKSSSLSATSYISGISDTVTTLI